MSRGGTSQGQGRAGRPPTGDPFAWRTLLASASVLVLLVLLAACSTTVTKRGQQFGENDLAQVQRGMTQDQVRNVLGTPATTASVGSGNAYYYISSTVSETPLTTPNEIDRHVVAVYFAQTGTVDRVAHYGLKDGKVFDFISRTTPSANTREEGLVKALFRNLGQKQLFGD
jgi:outer membrane protein assembly factor BamE (lipoprotein component of BamABCDE complex)